MPRVQSFQGERQARRMHGRHAGAILVACTALMAAGASCTRTFHLGLRGGQPTERAAWGGDDVERGRTMGTMRDPEHGAGFSDTASSLANRWEVPRRPRTSKPMPMPVYPFSLPCCLTIICRRLSGMGLGGGRGRLRVVKRSKDDVSICTLDTKMLFQRKEQGSDVKGPPVLGEIHYRAETDRQNWLPT